MALPKRTLSSGGGCDHDDGTVHEEGSCSGDDGSTHDDGGCDCGDSTSGPSDLCLQVVDSAGDKICWAGRPIRPGWQRDPRLACPIPAGFTGEFTLRVFQGQCGNTDMGAVVLPGDTPVVYLLYHQLIGTTP